MPESVKLLFHVIKTGEPSVKFLAGMIEEGNHIDLFTVKKMVGQENPNQLALAVVDLCSELLEKHPSRSFVVSVINDEVRKLLISYQINHSRLRFNTLSEIMVDTDEHKAVLAEARAIVYSEYPQPNAGSVGKSDLQAIKNRAKKDATPFFVSAWGIESDYAGISSWTYLTETGAYGFGVIENFEGGQVHNELKAILNGLKSSDRKTIVISCSAPEVKKILEDFIGANMVQPEYESCLPFLQEIKNYSENVTLRLILFAPENDNPLQTGAYYIAQYARTRPKEFIRQNKVEYLIRRAKNSFEDNKKKLSAELYSSSTAL